MNESESPEGSPFEQVVEKSAFDDAINDYGDEQEPGDFQVANNASPDPADSQEESQHKRRTLSDVMAEKNTAASSSQGTSNNSKSGEFASPDED